MFIEFASLDGEVTSIRADTITEFYPGTAPGRPDLKGTMIHRDPGRPPMFFLDEYLVVKETLSSIYSKLHTM